MTVDDDNVLSRLAEDGVVHPQAAAVLYLGLTQQAVADGEDPSDLLKQVAEELAAAHQQAMQLRDQVTALP